MKKFFGKVVVGVIGCVMALGMNAFAANEITIEKVDITNPATGAVTISGKITGDAAAPEATILVVPQGTELAELQDAQIRYIDQKTAQTGEFSFPFVLDPATVYDVYCGGTDVVAPDKDVINFNATTFQIVGTVTLPEGADPTKVTATATGKDPVKAGKDGKYTIEVEPGTYQVVVGRPGYLYRTFNDVRVVDQNVTLKATALLGGDVVVSDDASISLDDLMALLAAYNKTATDAEFNEAANLNDDTVISLDDLMILLNNYNSVAKDYDAE